MSIVDEIMEGYKDRTPRKRITGRNALKEEVLINKEELEERLKRQLVKTIAKELKCSVDTVQYYRKKYGLEKVCIKNH